MASSLNGLTVGDPLPENLMESPARFFSCFCSIIIILSFVEKRFQFSLSLNKTMDFVPLNCLYLLKGKENVANIGLIVLGCCHQRYVFFIRNTINSSVEKCYSAKDKIS